MKSKFLKYSALSSLVLSVLAVNMQSVYADDAHSEQQPFKDPHVQHQDNRQGVHKHEHPPRPYQVLPDNRVTFTVVAPQAKNVEVKGGWPGGINGDSTVELSKDSKGIWTTTVGPLREDIWNYQFIIDGVKAQVEAGRRGGDTNGLNADQLLIPGEVANDFVSHAVAKGNVTYTSTTFMGTEKRFAVYTPPNYFKSDERYPVLYLTLGGAHDGSRANEDSFIFNLVDNMIADKRIQPMMVVVMDPDAPGGSSLGDSSFRGGGNQTSQRYVEASQAIADSIVPFVDNAFRTKPDRENRAIGGFSSPGAQGFMAGARNPEKFASIFTFSGGFPTWPGVGKQITSKLHYPRYTGPDLNRVPDMEKLGQFIPKLNKDADMKLIYMSVGSDEPLIQTFDLMKDFLKKRGLNFESKVESGEIHDGHNIRVSLRDLLPRLFK